MKKFPCFSTLSIMLVIAGACKYDSFKTITPDNKPNLTPLSASEVTVGNASNDFAITFFKKVQSESASDNVFISPLSVTMALAMAMNGASDPTKQSIIKLLDFGNYSPAQVDAACKNLNEVLATMDRTVDVGLANSIWSNKNYALNDSFAIDIKNYFDGEAQILDFSDANSLKTINSWVASKTNNLIPNLLSQLSSQDVVLLINAIYFKGKWTNPFNPTSTGEAPFYNEDGSTQNVMTMGSLGEHLSFFRNSNLTLVDIPYGNKQFSMTVLMPQQGSTVAALCNSLTIDSLNQWLHRADTVTQMLFLPKFVVKWKKDLLADLRSLGLESDGYTKILNGNTQVVLSQVLQQTYISVDESGTEATAATTGNFAANGAGPPPFVNINRPFIYLIREKHTGAILFIGQMMMPTIQD